MTLMKKQKHPQLKELFYTDKNAYQREWRKLHPTKYVVKDEWRRLKYSTFDELPEDVVPVPNFPTYYARPNGEVWRDTRGLESAIKSGKERVIRLTATYNRHNGYWFVQPYQNGKRRPIHLHKVILTSFKGEAPEGMECHHIDSDTSNNCADNLMWVTHQQNMDYVPSYKFRGNRRTIEQGRKISTSKHSDKFPIIAELLKQGVPVLKIAEMLDMKKGSIYQIKYQLERRKEI